MGEKIPCPNCGSLNPEGAEWCSLCYTRFTAPEPPPPPPPAFVPESPGTVAGVQPGAAEGTSPAPPTPSVLTSAPTDPTKVGLTRGAFTVTELGVMWTCSVCEARNMLDNQTCAVCGTRFAEVVEPKETLRPERDPAMTTLVSFAFPGAGHAYLKMWGQAVTRAVLGLWLILVVFVTGVQEGVPGSAAIAIVFGIATLGLWAVSAHDAYQEARGEPAAVILQGKVLFYSVLGLLGLLVFMMMPAILGTR
ncbi:MAG: hypothetical protein ABR505_08045 [Actinomycetota bacterium]